MTGIDGTFIIRSSDPNVQVRLTFGDGAPIIVDGYGGWDIEPIAGRVGVTVWRGRNPMAVEIPFMINRIEQTYDRVGIHWPGEETEVDVRKLESLAGLGENGIPAICIVDGGGVIPHDYTISRQHRWVIDNIAWDRDFEVRNPATGRRLRCGGTLTLRKYQTATTLDRLKAPKSGGGPKRRKTYTVKRGDTLPKIAARKDVYGNSKKWKKIADANHIRDGRHLKVGQKLRIP